MSYKAPTELGKAIEEFFIRFGYENEYLKGRVINEWKDVVGDLIAENCVIKSFDGNILTLKTESSVWKSELFYRKKEIIEKINSRYNKKIVSDIRID